MTYKNICTKKTFKDKVSGQDKTIWLNAGTLRINDDGKEFIELNCFPDIVFYVFPPFATTRKQKDEAQEQFGG